MERKGRKGRQMKTGKMKEIDQKERNKQNTVEE